MKNSTEVASRPSRSYVRRSQEKKSFKSGYKASLNQQRKFVIVIVLIVLGNDAVVLNSNVSKYQCLIYDIIPYEKII